MNDVDFTAGLTLLALVERWQHQHITVNLAQAGEVSESLDRLGITATIGVAHIFESVAAAVEAGQVDANPEVGLPPP